MRGYAVIDIETTGFSYRLGHRIVELGVVELSPEGEVERAWETLINPQRHISATEVHGISAADVFGAPTFEEIADKLVSSLEGRVLVAHNAGFDAQFLCQELHECGRCGESVLPAIDTVKLARTYLGLPKSRLSDCCAHLGIRNELAHSALADAMATAQLLQHFMCNSPLDDDLYVREQRAASEGFAGLVCQDRSSEPMLHSREVAAQAREAAQGGGWFAGLVSGRGEPADSVAADYFELLDAALLDRQLSASEQARLVGFAKDNGLDSEGLRELHEAYITLLLEKAWEDGVITEEERGVLSSVARALGIPEADLDAALDVNPGATAHRGSHSRSEEDGESSANGGKADAAQVGNLGGITLNPGDRVTVTGAKKYSNADWGEYLAAHGVELGGLAKKTKVLIAADPDSQSGKAKKARDYGIPVIAEDVARDVIRFAE